MSTEEEIILEEEIIENEIVDNEEELIDNEENIVDNEPESEEEVEAKKYGHLSKEEWAAAGRDPAKYKTPEEFNKTGQVIEQLYTLKKKVDQRDREIQALVDYQQRTSQREYEKAKKDLQSQLASSKDDMDMEGVAHYTKELTRLEDMETQSHAQVAQQRQQQAQSAFIERNQHWFNDRNPDLKQRAIEIDNELKDKFPNADYDQLAELIEAKMIKEHPERVLGNARARSPSMSHSQSSINKTAVVRRNVFKDLSQEHKDTYHVYKRINPKITEADFIQRLKADGEI